MVIHSWEVFFCFLALWEWNVLAFSHNSKVSEPINLKRERGYFGRLFRFMIIQVHCFYTCGKAVLHAEGVWRANHSPDGEEKEGESGSEDPLQGPLRGLYFLKVPLPPNSCILQTTHELWAFVSLEIQAGRNGLPQCEVGFPVAVGTWHLREQLSPGDRKTAVSSSLFGRVADLIPKHLLLCPYGNPRHSLYFLTPLLKLN